MEGGEFVVSEPVVVMVVGVAVDVGYRCSSIRICGRHLENGHWQGGECLNICF